MGQRQERSPRTPPHEREARQECEHDARGDAKEVGHRRRSSRATTQPHPTQMAV